MLCGSVLNGQDMPNNFDKTFALEVKQIDEFIKRFNFDTSGQDFLKDYGKEYASKTKTEKAEILNRSFYIRSLFNAGNVASAEINKFISDVVDSSGKHKNQVKIDFYDNDWYAMLDCDFEMFAKTHKITLILKNQVKENRVSKWVIFGVLSDPLFKEKKTSVKLDSMKIMHPMSHAAGFMRLEESLNDKKNAFNYYKKDFNPDILSEFYILTQYNILKFKQINTISYHLFQIPNWYIKINQFNRTSQNTGWLISNLKKMNINEKLKFKKANLNVD